jgi:endonuclease/exonuclease/phosphatase family metal-dependent hydrolase
MASSGRSWEYVACLADGTALADGRGVDVVLLQEALRPTSVPNRWRIVPDRADDAAWSTAASLPRKFTTAVVVCDQSRDVEPLPVVPVNDPAYSGGQVLAASHLGTFRPVRLTDGDQSMIVVSTYGLQDDKTAYSKTSYAMTTLHRTLSDLTPLLHGPQGRRVILGGDLNAGTQYWQGRLLDSWSETLWQRVVQFGLTDCLPAFVPTDRGGLERCACGGGAGCRHTLTSRVRRANARPWENDHLLTMPGIHVLCCFAANGPDSLAWSYSDHCPVVADIEVVK